VPSLHLHLFDNQDKRKVEDAKGAPAVFKAIALTPSKVWGTNSSAAAAPVHSSAQDFPSLPGGPVVSIHHGACETPTLADAVASTPKAQTTLDAQMHELLQEQTQQNQQHQGPQHNVQPPYNVQPPKAPGSGGRTTHPPDIDAARRHSIPNPIEVEEESFTIPENAGGAALPPSTGHTPVDLLEGGFIESALPDGGAQSLLHEFSHTANLGQLQQQQQYQQLLMMQFHHHNLQHQSQFPPSAQGDQRMVSPIGGIQRGGMQGGSMHGGIELGAPHHAQLHTSQQLVTPAFFAMGEVSAHQNASTVSSLHSLNSSLMSLGSPATSGGQMPIGSRVGTMQDVYGKSVSQETFVASNFSNSPIHSTPMSAHGNDVDETALGTRGFGRDLVPAGDFWLGGNDYLLEPLQPEGVFDAMQSLDDPAMSMPSGSIEKDLLPPPPGLPYTRDMTATGTNGLKEAVRTHTYFEGPAAGVGGQDGLVSAVGLQSLEKLPVGMTTRGIAHVQHTNRNMSHNTSHEPLSDGASASVAVAAVAASEGGGGQMGLQELMNCVLSNGSGGQKNSPLNQMLHGPLSGSSGGMLHGPLSGSGGGLPAMPVLPMSAMSLTQVEQGLNQISMPDSLKGKSASASSKGKAANVTSTQPVTTSAPSAPTSRGRGAASVVTARDAKLAASDRTHRSGTGGGVGSGGAEAPAGPRGTWCERDLVLRQIPTSNVRFERNECLLNLDKMSFTDGDLVVLAPLLAAHLRWHLCLCVCLCVCFVCVRACVFECVRYVLPRISRTPDTSDWNLFSFVSLFRCTWVSFDVYEFLWAYLA